MKKPFVLIAAIVAVAGLDAAVAVAKERTEVKTSVTLQRHGEGAPCRAAVARRGAALPAGIAHRGCGLGAFWGQVKARKGCQKGRRVVLYSINGGKVREGSDRTNDRGKYKIKWPGLSERRFFVKATEKRITKSNGDQVASSAGKSKRLRLR